MRVVVIFLGLMEIRDDHGAYSCESQIWAAIWSHGSERERVKKKIDRVEIWVRFALLYSEMLQHQSV
jgi:hypothetical protein